jgi:hypothetical protein
MNVFGSTKIPGQPHMDIGVLVKGNHFYGWLCHHRTMNSTKRREELTNLADS